MRRLLRTAFIALAAAMLGACADNVASPVSSATPALRPRLNTTADWIISDLQSEYGGTFSFDTSEAGLTASPRYDLHPIDESGEFCRDHFKPIDLSWNGGWGIAVIHLDPPLLFRGYRSGTFTDRRRLVWRKAIYETLQAGEGVDPAGNVWRFQGRFNALCRGGSREIGPIVFNAQLLVSQDPIDRPVLVRRGDTGGDGCGGGGGTELIAVAEYDPYDPMSGSSTDGGGCTEEEDGGTRYGPGDSTGGETVDWGTGVGNGGSSVCGQAAVVEYVCIDVWDDTTGRWVEWGCGYVTTC